MSLSEEQHGARIVHINHEKWFVETRTGYAGPYLNKQEAKRYLELLQAIERIPNEFSGLEFSPS